MFDSDSPLLSLGEPDDSDSDIKARRFSDASPAPAKSRRDKPSLGSQAAAASAKVRPDSLTPAFGFCTGLLCRGPPADTVSRSHADVKDVISLGVLHTASEYSGIA